MAADDGFPNWDAAAKHCTDCTAEPLVGQTQFDLEFYDQVLQRNANNVDALRQLVELLARHGDYKRALELDRRLVRLEPDDVVARYNLACSLAVLGHVDDAVVALDEALELGYCDWAHLESDVDLEVVREHPGFQRLLVKFGLD